jgi:hypothetical protein
MATPTPAVSAPAPSCKIDRGTVKPKKGKSPPRQYVVFNKTAAAGVTPEYDILHSKPDGWDGQEPDQITKDILTAIIHNREAFFKAISDGYAIKLRREAEVAAAVAAKLAADAAKK